MHECQPEMALSQYVVKTHKKNQGLQSNTLELRLTISVYFYEFQNIVDITHAV